MARFSQNGVLQILLGVTLLVCATHAEMIAQRSSSPQEQVTSASSQHKPVSLAHLYWHFLVYQNQLDTRAASEESQGRSGSWMRNHHKAQLGLSDSDYDLIRNSSSRLVREVDALNAQAAAIKAAGNSAASSAQLKALTAQQEADINAEIAFLKQNLSEKQIKTLEAYIVQLFAPKSVSIQASSTSGKSDAPAVQQ